MSYGLDDKIAITRLHAAQASAIIDGQSSAEQWKNLPGERGLPSPLAARFFLKHAAIFCFVQH
jgi:hypothetical protein